MSQESFKISSVIFYRDFVGGDADNKAGNHLPHGLENRHISATSAPVHWGLRTQNQALSSHRGLLFFISESLVVCRVFFGFLADSFFKWFQWSLGTPVRDVFKGGWLPVMVVRVCGVVLCLYKRREFVAVLKACRGMDGQA